MKEPDASDQKYSALNGSQRHRLLITCKHIDTLLESIDETLNASASKRVFTSYIDDITPQQRRTIEEYILRIREQLLRVMAEQALAPDEPQISAAHSIDVGLSFIDIAIAELAPRYMRGYGPVSEEAATDLQRIVVELQSVVRELRSYMVQPRSA
jgi:hypothetical protein